MTRLLTPSAVVRGPLVLLAATRMARAARPAWPVDPLPGLDPGTSISVVVPARNEATRIGPLLAALAEDPAVGEVMVVDDESTDATAEVARRAGAEVITGRPLPDGWAGKVWALEQGVEAAAGEWVVCLDADTEPRPGFVGALVRRAVLEGWDLVTAGARFVCDTPGQRWLHPAMLTTLVVRFGPPAARGRPPRPDRVLANGQCLAFRRRHLLQEGGWALVRDNLVEDVALARLLAGRGWRVGFVDASTGLAVRMHDTGRQTWRAWGRSLPLVDVTTPAWLAVDLATVWAAQGLPLVRMLAGRGDAVDVVALALRLGTLVGTAPAYVRRGAAYWLSPLADLPVAVRLTKAALRPERSWRGRRYGPPTRPGRTAGR